MVEWRNFGFWSCDEIQRIIPDFLTFDMIHQLYCTGYYMTDFHHAVIPLSRWEELKNLHGYTASHLFGRRFFIHSHEDKEKAIQQK